MLDVAFSRRMCCSRVPSASRSAGFALGVLGDADQPARHLALERVPGGEKGGVRAAESQRHAEALGRAHRDVRAEFPRRAQQRQREQVGRRDAEGPGRVRAGEEPRIIVDRAGGVRILHEHAEAAGAGREGAVVADHDPDSERLGPGPHDLDRLRVADARRRRIRRGPRLRRPASAGGTSSSPRPRRCPRRASRRWRSPARSGR